MKIDQTDFNTVLASDSVDKHRRVWPVYPDAISAMCAKLTANMSHQQWAELGVARHRPHQRLPRPPVPAD